MKYEKGNPSEVIAITGRSIDGLKLVSKGMIWPFQNASALRVNVQPSDYALQLRAMTKEKLQLEIPVVFTIGPDCFQQSDDGVESRNMEALKRYAMLLARANSKDNRSSHVGDIVKGIIEGETRVIVSSMTMEEICQEREIFKRRINNGIESELKQFGLKIYNANIKELTDAPNSNYFEVISRKAHESASNNARVDVAQAQWKGTVGEAERRGAQEREVAKILAETAVAKTERDTEKSQAEALFAARKAAFDRDVQVAQIEATRATETRDEELRKDVEIRRAQTEIERLRASDVVKATILRESKQQAADAKAYEMQKAAEADQFREQKAADAHAYKTKIDSEAAYLAAAKDAEAKLYRKAKDAEGLLISQQKEAEGRLIQAQKEAEGRLAQQAKEAEGLSKMAEAYGKMSHAFGGPEGLLKYMMIKEGVYTDLARANATAVQGMQPKMTIWNTGSNGSGNSDGHDGSDPAAAIRNTYQTLPPLMTTIHEQTGLSLPAWQFGKLGAAVGEIQSGSISSSD